MSFDSLLRLRQLGTVTDQDLEAVRALFCGDGVMTTNQLARLVWRDTPSEQMGQLMARRRLSLLAGHHYKKQVRAKMKARGLGIHLIARHPRQAYLGNVLERLLPLHLDGGDLRVLADTDEAHEVVAAAYGRLARRPAPHKLRLKPAQALLDSHKLLHNLVLAQFWVEVADVVARDGQLRLAWLGQRLSFRRWPVGDGNTHAYYAPDAMLFLQRTDERGDVVGEAPFYLELDMGQMTVGEVAHKVVAQQAWYRSGLWQREVDQPDRFPLTLVVTTTDERAQHLSVALRDRLDRIGALAEQRWWITSGEVAATSQFTGAVWYSTDDGLLAARKSWLASDLLHLPHARAQWLKEAR